MCNSCINVNDYASTQLIRRATLTFNDRLLRMIELRIRDGDFPAKPEAVHLEHIAQVN